MASVVLTFSLLMISAFVVSDLPRPGQGENVSAPWSACFLSGLAAAIFLPWLVFLQTLTRPWQRVYFLLCLTGAAVGWYFFGGLDDLFSKAYRRGL